MMHVVLRVGHLLVASCVFYLMMAYTSAEEVVLLDTTRESILNWKKYRSSPQMQTQGWLEESYTNFEKGINWRSYVVCDVAHKEVNNWLWTPFIERKEAERMFIELKFSTRDCSQFRGMALTCKETFSLLYYEFDAATREPPPWERDSYQLIDRIAADEGRSSSRHDDTVNIETRSIAVTKKGVYFAIRDQGACVSLLAVRVYYRTCAETVSGLARFPATPTAQQGTEIKTVVGSCVENAVRRDTDRSPSYICKGDGRWSLLDAGCVCKPGYQADTQLNSCRVCQTGHYKSDVGNSRCAHCPEHSAAPYTASVQCRCDTGYFRTASDPPSAPCTQPPSAVKDLRVQLQDYNSAVLTWNPPVYTGGRSDTRYSIKCPQCGADVVFSPSQDGLNMSRVTISGLAPATGYTIHVDSRNGVSSLAPGTPASAKVHLTTKPSVPSMVREVRVRSVGANSVVLTWLPPALPSGVTALNYEVQYYERPRRVNTVAAAIGVSVSDSASFHGIRTHDQGSSTGPTDDGANGSQIVGDLVTTSATIGRLKTHTEYGFQVRARTSRGWGEPSAWMFVTTDSHVTGTAFTGEGEGEVNVRVIAGGTVAVIAVLVILVIVAIMFIRSRSNEECSKKQPSDCDTLEYRNGEVHHPCGNSVIRTHTATMSTPLYNATLQRRTYIDPHTYEDPNQAIREFVREIDASHIIIEAVIGGGEFGDVCRGKLRIPGRQEMTVAIKTLKPGSTEKARVDFLTEASIMGQFEHPSVIFLQGVVTHTNPVMIVTEFMENGSLDTFLRANDGKFQVLQLVAMLRGIASGMQYLSEMSYVHRDLAARNVLVNTMLVCKIADFGLSREIEGSGEGAYTTRGGKIPVRWTAPEAIVFRKFTSASDVWSFGVVCWEVMSYGERPYWNWSNQDVIKSIEKAYRLPAPMDCPEAMHQLMLDCWQRERAHRPVFSSVVKTLDTLVACPETLNKIAANRNTNPLAPDAPDLTRIASVDEWLASIKMSRYLESLRRAGVDSMEAVSRLTHADLPALGITLVGHQKKVMNSVQALRAQLHANLSEAYFV